MTKVAIGAIMKQEAPYILEWVYYHKELGFELIIADNGGNDNTSKILASFHSKNHIHWQVFQFETTIHSIIPELFINCSVLGLGSHRVNGSIRELFDANKYISIDLSEGNDVDVMVFVKVVVVHRTLSRIFLGISSFSYILFGLVNYYLHLER